MRVVDEEDLVDQHLISKLRKEYGMTYNDFFMVLTDVDLRVKVRVPVLDGAVPFLERETHFGGISESIIHTTEHKLFHKWGSLEMVQIVTTVLWNLWSMENIGLDDPL